MQRTGSTRPESLANDPNLPTPKFCRSSDSRHRRLGTVNGVTIPPSNDQDAIGRRTQANLSTLATAPVGTFTNAPASVVPVAVNEPQLFAPAVPAPTEQKKSGRIVGIDMARGIAMFAMTVVHFVNFREDPGADLATFAELFRGRAMPLFMMLGGVGVTFLTRRSSTPSRDLIIRAVMLFALGLFMTEHVPRLAIVLQSYGLFFILAIVLFRLPSKVLVSLVPLITAVGAWTYQVVGEPRVQTRFDELLTAEGPQSLVFDGFYPLFPVGAFFIAGIVLGRIDLRSDRVAAALASVGVVTGVGIRVGADFFASAFNLRTDFGGNAGDGMFHLTRLLDSQGHSAMPAWVLSALGTSIAVLGLSLLIAKRVPKLVSPLVAVGSMSLTYYVYQAWLTNVVPPTMETSTGAEWIFTILVYSSFVILALVWRLWFRSGPLERVLRIGSGPRLVAPTQVPVASGPFG